MVKLCSRCKIDKEETDFSPSQLGHKYSVCRGCVKMDKAKYTKRHPERVKAATRKCYLNNIQSRKAYSRVWGQNNKDKRNAYLKDKRKDDPFFRLRELISCHIREILKRNGGSKKGDSFLKCLPYTINDLKQHIESQFESWMTWDNQGMYCVDIWNDEDPATWTWQIDHIIPHTALPYTTMMDNNFYKCWALENLRPLSAKQNLLKSDKVEAA